MKGESWAKQNFFLFFIFILSMLAVNAETYREFQINMTSNTAPAPYAVVASSEADAGSAAWRAFNAPDSSDNWASAEGQEAPSWIYQFHAEARIITNVSLKARDNGASVDADRMPQDFAIQGSNDNVTWTNLTAITGQTSWAWGNPTGEQRTFYVGSTTPYTAHRIYVTANNGGSRTAIGYIRFWYDTNYTPPATASARPNITFYNVTSGTVFSEGDMQAPFITNDSTPTFFIKTDSPAYCRINNTDSNYSSTSNTTDCVTADNTNHTCTPTAAITAPHGVSNFYISCVPTAYTANETAVSTSGALLTYADYNFPNVNVSTNGTSVSPRTDMVTAYANFTDKDNDDLNRSVYKWQHNGVDIEFGNTAVVVLHLDNSTLQEGSTSPQFTAGNLSCDEFMTGKISQSCYFSGYSYLRTTDYVAGLLDNFSQFTLSAWIHPDSVVGTQSIIEKNGPYVMWLNGNTLYAGIYNGSQWTYVSGVTTINANEWTHVAFTHDINTGLMTTYVNGNYDANTSVGGQMIAAGGTLIVGGGSFVGLNPDVRFFTGYIDEVRIYNRTLSAVEVTDLYNQTWYGQARLEEPKAGLIARYAMDGNINDSINGNNFTIGSGVDCSATGVLNHGCHFDGTNALGVGTYDYMNTPTQATYSFWVKPGENLASFGDFMGRYINWYFEIDFDNSRNIYFIVQNNSDAGYSLGGYNSLPRDEWSYVVGTVDADADNMSLYLDGELIGTQVFNGELKFTYNTTYIGGLNPYGQRQNATLDEILWYNRALNPEEIKYIYEHTASDYKRDFKLNITSYAQGDNLSFAAKVYDNLTAPNLDGFTYTSNITIDYNGLPTWNTTIPNVSLNEGWSNFTHITGLSNYVNDSDGDAITITSSINVSGVECSITNDVLNVTRTTNFIGTALCTLSADDGLDVINYSFVIESNLTNTQIITSINCVNCYYGDDSEIYVTENLTPTLNFNTSVASDFSISDVNGSFVTCEVTGGTNHTCTLGLNQNLGVGSDFVFLNGSASGVVSPVYVYHELEFFVNISQLSMSGSFCDGIRRIYFQLPPKNYTGVVSADGQVNKQCALNISNTDFLNGSVRFYLNPFDINYSISVGLRNSSGVCDIRTSTNISQEKKVLNDSLQPGEFIEFCLWQHFINPTNYTYTPRVIVDVWNK